MTNMLSIKIIDGEFSVLKVASLKGIDLTSDFTFSAKTDEEISLVCPSKNIPADYIECDGGWRCFRIQGVLDFSLIGILARISKILADNNIGIFVISTYNTDYILTKADRFDTAVKLLSDKEYKIEK